MLFKEVHTFYTELIGELDKEGKQLIADAEAKLPALANTITAALAAAEKDILAQYASSSPEVQQAAQLIIQLLEQAAAAAIKSFL